MAETKDELPVLPEPCHRAVFDGAPFFTADQMHAYAREAVSKAVDPLDKMIGMQHTQLVATLGREAELQREVGELRKDAERYRWLRDSSMYAWPFGDGPEMVWCVIGASGYDNRPADGAELDTAIDAAMASGDRAARPQAADGV